MEKAEPPILAAANRMLERFGEDAVREVEVRIAELKEHGEFEAVAFWQQVLRALLELRGKSSDHTKH